MYARIYHQLVQHRIGISSYASQSLIPTAKIAPVIIKTASSSSSSSSCYSNNNNNNNNNKMKEMTVRHGSGASGNSSDKSSDDRVVVLGSGWGGFQLAQNINPDVNLTVISPRNHFVFTPLLPSASVGTLECRCIQEPIRSVLSENGRFLQAKARSIDVDQQHVVCESIDNAVFSVPYDKLVIAVGVKTNTFGITSVSDDANRNDGSIFYLKQLKHARAIRSNIIKSFEKASIPGLTDIERNRLLTFVVVGGGPTSCEFTAELHDFVMKDVKRLYKSMLPFDKILIVEAGPALLGPFDAALQKYTHGLFKRRKIDVRLGTAVVSVEEYTDPIHHFSNSTTKRAVMSDGTKVEFGTMIWSAGLAPRTFTATLDNAVFPRHNRSQRLLTDEYLRVQNHEGTIWAIGDAAVNDSGPPLPQLAQVARQQGIYLSKVFNGKTETSKPFDFFSLGSMASVGEWKGVYDGSSVGRVRDPATSSSTDNIVDTTSSKYTPALKGFAALVLWRFAYWGRQTSVVNKILIPMYWCKAAIFGRDTTNY